MGIPVRIGVHPGILLISFNAVQASSALTGENQGYAEGAWVRISHDANQAVCFISFSLLFLF